ncbi:hypothetical protein Ahy_B06g084019 isoform A [Arachis hypogaea]|uniref:Protein FAR1-RELATED SEQUENCE n=1 Tax=Arachis hypogaea TaxID=3818 RepID=A0A444YQT8_ARAHY|nr:hypothetical protein Ahy_B06g084019 isoform A [Arachis hypogaea]
MKRAIEVGIPTTIHRWCIWYIMKKILSKLNGYKRHKKIKHEKSHVFWNSFTKESFDRTWNDFLIKYGVGDNKWLSDNDRCQTVRLSYDNCLSSREQRERIRYCRFSYHHTLCNKFSIEAQLQHVYTHEMFRKVQAQFRENVNFITRLMQSTISYTVYEVVEHISNSTFNKFVVTYDTISSQVKCQYLLFESRGILCRHSLRALNKVSPRYILEQWSKNVKRKHTHLKSSHDGLFWSQESQNIYEFASKFELTTILHSAYDNAMVEMQEYKAKSKRKCSLFHEDVSLEDINEIQRPLRLNLFCGGSVVQSNFRYYHGHITNYNFRGSRE